MCVSQTAYVCEVLMISFAIYFGNQYYVGFFGNRDVSGFMARSFVIHENYYTYPKTCSFISL